MELSHMSRMSHMRMDDMHAGPGIALSLIIDLHTSGGAYTARLSHLAPPYVCRSNY